MKNLVRRVLSLEKILQGNYRYYLASQQIFIAALVLHVFFLILFSRLKIVELAYFNIFSIAVYLVIIFINRRGLHPFALYLAYLEVNMHALYAVFLLGWDTGFFYYILAIGPMLFFYSRTSVLWKLSLSLISVLLLVSLYIYTLGNQHVYTLDSYISISMYVANLACTFLFLAYMSYYYAQAAGNSESRLRKMSSEYEKLATRDSLTGLLNRRAMHDKLEKEVSMFNRSDRPFVLVVGDIDNFKSLNDKYGHLGGDEIIRSVSEILLQGIREYDIICRWGGEEFLLILHDCQIGVARTRIDNIRQKIETYPIAYHEEIITATMTFGLCEYKESVNINECIEIADKALYYGKQMGKNCIEGGVNK